MEASEAFSSPPISRKEEGTTPLQPSRGQKRYQTLSVESAPSDKKNRLTVISDVANTVMPSIIDPLKQKDIDLQDQTHSFSRNLTGKRKLPESEKSRVSIRKLEPTIEEELYAALGSVTTKRLQALAQKSAIKNLADYLVQHLSEKDLKRGYDTLIQTGNSQLLYEQLHKQEQRPKNVDAALKILQLHLSMKTDSGSTPIETQKKIEDTAQVTFREIESNTYSITRNRRLEELDVIKKKN